MLVRTWAAKVKRGLVLVSKAMHISSFVSVACQAKHPPAAACSFPAFGLKQLIHAWCGAGISSETPVDEQDPVGHAEGGKLRKFNFNKLFACVAELS